MTPDEAAEGLAAYLAERGIVATGCRSEDLRALSEETACALPPMYSAIALRLFGPECATHFGDSEFVLCPEAIASALQAFGEPPIAPLMRFAFITSATSEHSLYLDTESLDARGDCKVLRGAGDFEGYPEWQEALAPTLFSHLVLRILRKTADAHKMHRQEFRLAHPKSQERQLEDAHFVLESSPLALARIPRTEGRAAEASGGMALVDWNGTPQGAVTLTIYAENSEELAATSEEFSRRTPKGAWRQRS